MKIIDQSHHIYWPCPGEEMLRTIELAGRVSYKSEGRITADSAATFVKMLIERGHHSVLEHVSVSVRVITDRGVTHEIVRHRIASYTQESTRFCNYSKGKFGGEITVIRPAFLGGSDPNGNLYLTWEKAMLDCEAAYLRLLKAGATPQNARSVLPNSLKTEIVITMNLREWRHFFRLRAAKGAHPDMRALVLPILSEFRAHVPVIFDDPAEGV